MEDWGAVRARLLLDAEEMDGIPVSFDKAAATGVSADIRAALERVEELERAIATKDTAYTLLINSLRDDALTFQRRAEAAEAKLARCVEALARLAGTPAVRMALGEKHTPDCPCPLCVARAALAAARGEE